MALLILLSFVLHCQTVYSFSISKISNGPYSCRSQFVSTSRNHAQPLQSSVLSSSSSLSTEKVAMSNQICVLLGNENKLSYFQTKPFKTNVTWSTVFDQLSEKCSWEYLNNKQDIDLSKLGLNIISVESLQQSITTTTTENKIKNKLSFDDYSYPIYVLIGIDTNQQTLVESITKKATTIAVFDSDESIYSIEKYGFYSPTKAKESPLCNTIQNWFDEKLKTDRFLHRNSYLIAQDMWNRHSCDDLLFMLFVLFDMYTSISIKSVQAVTSTEETGWSEIQCMGQNCAKEMIDCFADENCRKALNCLNNCKGNDQVCSYRCITSHESETFEKFALCILQRNNCMKNSALVPIYPDPPPLSHFRQKELTHEIAEGIFIGHLELPLAAAMTDSLLHPSSSSSSSSTASTNSAVNPMVTTTSTSAVTTITSTSTATTGGGEEAWSWKVVCGQNPAYDYFGCQHQIFYKDPSKPSVMWYDPVFKVTTIYGKEVWRRRHYRVRRGKQPGQFYFSVIDNGVASNEFWRILDAADDLSWAVFYYCGAASAAGTNYKGALVVTPSGKWPEMTEDTATHIASALERGGIKIWELFEVSNENCGADCKAGPPPLGIPLLEYSSNSSSSSSSSGSSIGSDSNSWSEEGGKLVAPCCEG